MSIETFLIPREVEAFDENTIPSQVMLPENIEYKVRKGEYVKVLLWVRYPSYDFIFGVPRPDSPKYAKEIGFFQVRDSRSKITPRGHYFDITEVEEMIDGFEKILEFSREHSPHLWKEKNK